MAKKTVRNLISAEEFTAKYVELFNNGFNSETGESTATISDVAAYFGMTPQNAYQKVRSLNTDLKEAGLDFQLPKMKMSNTERKTRVDLTAIAALAASAKARQALDLLD
mgnify:CR=1 FL=1